MSCLTPKQLSDYCARDLSPEEMLLYNRHVASCPECKAAVLSSPAALHAASSLLLGIVDVETTCPESEQLFDFVDGDISKKKASQIGMHLQTCRSCSRVVADIRSLAAEAFPGRWEEDQEPVHRSRGWLSPGSAIAVAGMMLVAAAFLSFRSAPQFQQAAILAPDSALRQPAPPPYAGMPYGQSTESLDPGVDAKSAGSSAARTEGERSVIVYAYRDDARAEVARGLEGELKDVPNLSFAGRRKLPGSYDASYLARQNADVANMVVLVTPANEGSATKVSVIDTKTGREVEQYDVGAGVGTTVAQASRSIARLVVRGVTAVGSAGIGAAMRPMPPTLEPPSQMAPSRMKMRAPPSPAVAWYTVCTESGKKATRYCPSTERRRLADDPGTCHIHLSSAPPDSEPKKPDAATEPPPEPGMHPEQPEPPLASPPADAPPPP